VKLYNPTVIGIKGKKEEAGEKQEAKKAMSHQKIYSKSDKTEAIGTIGAVVTGWLARRKLKHRMKSSFLIHQFAFAYELKKGNWLDLWIIIKQQENPHLFKIIVSNRGNRSRDDMIFIKTFKLPGDLTVHDKIDKFQEVFKDRLRIILQPKGQFSMIEKMADAFIDNSFVKE